jgi:uncharacterized protein HemX
MTQRILAWVQIIVIIGGGLIAWGKLSQKLDDAERTFEQQHEEIMQQISQENQRILAIEQEVFRAYSGGPHGKQ